MHLTGVKYIKESNATNEQSWRDLKLSEEFVCCSLLFIGKITDL